MAASGPLLVYMQLKGSSSPAGPEEFASLHLLGSCLALRNGSIQNITLEEKNIPPGGSGQFFLVCVCVSFLELVHDFSAGRPPSGKANGLQKAESTGN